MKKIINQPLSAVREMLEGAVATTPGQALLERENVVVRHPLPERGARAVALLSGGGSGHEPAHAGFVGAGMLTAAVAGDVFTSPSTDAVLAGIRAVSGPAGAVLIVKNYTGDRLNFGLAAELARAEGIAVEVVVVADDVALRDTVERSRRRGIAGTVLVHKIAGAAAAAGADLKKVAEFARAAAEDIGTMGVALGACTLPAAGRPNFELGANEIELGLGIHGEPGVRKAPMASADELVDTLLSSIIDDRGLSKGSKVAVLVNGLGSTPPMELSIVARSTLRNLERRGIVAERCYVGTLLSALDMPGMSLSLMRVDDERLAQLDAATDAPAWPGAGLLNPLPVIASAADAGEDIRAAVTPGGDVARRLALAAAAALTAAETELTELDAKAGDGDLGASMARAAEAIRALPEHAWNAPAHALTEVGNALRRAIGGSSGPFYATALLRASRALTGTGAAPEDLAKAFDAAVAAISELGGARRGDRTMVDALAPASAAFRSAIAAGLSPAKALSAAADAANAGAEETRSMRPRLGRASYLGERAVGVPDGGAVAAAIWLRAIADA
ncbi:MAG: dihydroxyacetone kinase subunit DhaK [Rhizobiaceae bacterium]|nr:dihydroxyacetone kinase subunit DhaK [Rhizobiaceae bacterium]